MKTSMGAGLAGAGLVAGLVIAGLNVASAQTSPTPTPSAGADAKPGKHPGRGDRLGNGIGKGIGRGALHGEVTTKAPGGGYQVLAMQHGAATAVSATSITVRSEDGFSRTYAVTDDTMVRAGDNGIADVKTGDDVNVVAVVTGGTARAVRVLDVTRAGELRKQWHPRAKRPAPSQSAAA